MGITPEAPHAGATRWAARAPDEIQVITPADIAHALASLSTVAAGTPITAVCLGTPHFSLDEWDRLMPAARGRGAAPGIRLYVNHGRDTLRSWSWTGGSMPRGARGLIPRRRHLHLHHADPASGSTAPVMTNSGKWAHYAPGNIGVEVAFGSLEDCMRSAAAGCVTRVES